MTDKFYNYLYDYLTTKKIITNIKVRDQKEKRLIASQYLTSLSDHHHKILSSPKSTPKKNLLHLYFQKYVIKYSDIPLSYWKSQEQIYLDQGLGHHHLTESEKQKLGEIIINDQKKSLEKILNYFTSDDALFYPDSLKFWAFQGLISLGKYDKNTHHFSKRTKGTTTKFPEINREALSLSIETMQNYLTSNNITDQELYTTIFQDNGGLNTSFAKLYSYYLTKVATNINKETSSIKGLWMKYPQHSNHLKLVKDLEGKGTGWCTVGENVAKSQLERGDFYVYYTKDKNDNFIYPRIAIRMNGSDKIGEIRGIAQDEEMEPEMLPILEEKLQDFPDASSYKKKISDTKTLTTIYNKYLHNYELTLSDLAFIYEVESKVTTFSEIIGSTTDPRLTEIISTRNYLSDLNRILASDKYHYLNLTLSSAKGLIIPKTFTGCLNINNLETAEGLIIPNNFYETLNLRNLQDASSLHLPALYPGFLILNSLEDATNLYLTEGFTGTLSLHGLENPSTLTIPDHFKGTISLPQDIDLSNLHFPKTFSGHLKLYDQNTGTYNDIILPRSKSPKSK